MLVKLLSSDEKIVLLEHNIIKQMVTIQTMMDCSLVNESKDEDEPIPVAVNGEVLNNLVGWTKYHLENNGKSDFKDWSLQFFMDHLENILALEDGAKYLEL